MSVLGSATQLRTFEAHFTCPRCRGRLRAAADELNCSRCGTSYPIRGGVPSFSDGSEFYEGRFTYMTLDTAERAVARGRSMLLERLRWDYSIHRARFFERHMRRPGRVLDIGCAAGTPQLTRTGPVIGVDLSHDGPARAQALAGYAAAAQAEIGRLPFEPGSFDYVVSLDVIGHLDDPTTERMLDDIESLVAPGGVTIHAIETDGTIRRWARRLDPALYQRHLVDAYGHIGLEAPSAVLSRLTSRGWRLIDVEPALHFTVATWLESFDNELRERSRALDMSVRLAAGVTSVPYGAFATNRLLGAAQALRGRVRPLDSADALFVAAIPPSR